MKIEELKYALEASTNGKIANIDVKWSYKGKTQIGFEVETVHPIPSNDILDFTDSFTMMAIGEAKYYIAFTTELIG
jgi:hypothetical protein